MTSNFTFAFNRMIPPSAWANAPVSRAPVSRAPVSRAPVSNAPVSRAPVSNAPVSRAPVSNAPVSRTAAIANVPMTRSNRFSMTRMINFKSSGGCRACN